MLKSNDLLLVVIGTILSGVLAIFISNLSVFDLFRINNFNLLWITIFVLFLIVIITIWIFYMRIREAESDILNQSIEQKKLNEKLKIYESLSNLKAEIKYLQKRIDKNETR